MVLLDRERSALDQLSEELCIGARNQSHNDDIRDRVREIGLRLISASREART